MLCVQSCAECGCRWWRWRRRQREFITWHSEQWAATAEHSHGLCHIGYICL